MLVNIYNNCRIPRTKQCINNFIKPIFFVYFFFIQFYINRINVMKNILTFWLNNITNCFFFCFYIFAPDRGALPKSWTRTFLLGAPEKSIRISSKWMQHALWILPPPPKKNYLSFFHEVRNRLVGNGDLPVALRKVPGVHVYWNRDLTA